MLITEYPPIALSILLVTLTIMSFQFFVKIQKKINSIWFNPMLFSIVVISVFIIYIDMPFIQYYESTKALNILLKLLSKSLPISFESV